MCSSRESPYGRPAVRRPLTVLSLVSAAVLAWGSSALAFTTPPDTSAVSGTCTVPYGTGSPVPITSFEVQYPPNPFRAAAGGVVMDYYLTAWCGVNGNGNNEFVMQLFTTAASTWSIDDAAGTLTVSGMTLPSSYVGDTFNGTGEADISTGAGPLSPVVWGADNSTEKSTVVSYHRKITRAKTDTERASNLNFLRAALL